MTAETVAVTHGVVLPYKRSRKRMVMAKATLKITRQPAIAAAR